LTATVQNCLAEACAMVLDEIAAAGGSYHRRQEPSQELPSTRIT